MTAKQKDFVLHFDTKPKKRIPVTTALFLMLDHSALDARQIVEAALGIAADICIYTNHSLTIEELGA